MKIRGQFTGTWPIAYSQHAQPQHDQRRRRPLTTAIENDRLREINGQLVASLENLLESPSADAQAEAAQAIMQARGQS